MMRIISAWLQDVPLFCCEMSDAKASKSLVEGRLEDDLLADETPATVTLPHTDAPGERKSYKFHFSGSSCVFYQNQN